MILRLKPNSQGEAVDGIYVWNGKGWDLASVLPLNKPHLVVRNNEVLWLDIPIPQESEKPKKKTTGEKTE